MNDLNCPNCGTTYQSTKAGYCDCCGFEFTEAYINQLVSAEKEKEKKIQHKMAEENRRKQLLIEKEEKERKAKAKTEKKARIEAEKAYIKEKKDREKVVSLIEKNNKKYENDLKFSLFFKKFRKVISTLGIILAISSIVSSIVFSDQLSADFIVPQNVILNKFETVLDEHFVVVKFDDEQNLLKKSEDTEDSVKLSKGAIKLFNSISSLINNQKTVEEKLTYMFPKSTAFVNKFIGSSEVTENVSETDEDFSEKNK